MNTMLNKIKEGFFIGLGIFLFFGVLFGLVYAVGFHTADEVIGGTFNGNYSFTNGLTIKQNCHPNFSQNALNLDYCLATNNTIRIQGGNVGGYNNLSLNPYGGNVGIGTLTPVTKLSINGNISAKAICDETGSNCQNLSSGSIGGSYALITVNGGVNIGLNQRHIETNPFGIDTPVIVQAEIFYNGVWSDTGFIHEGGGYGVQANYVEGVGIVVQTGQSSLLAGAAASMGGGHGQSSTTSSAPSRVHIWKLG